MRIKLLFILIAALIFSCHKDDDGTTGPDTNPNGNGNGAEITSFVIIRHADDTGAFEQLPNSVVLQFQVTSLEGEGVDFLTADRFQVYEDDVKIDANKSAMYVLKKKDIQYLAKTKLLIDNNAGSNLTVLKNLATDIISKMDTNQEIAVYTVSDVVQMVQDFTRDSAALLAAVNAIAEGGADSDLYGGMMQMMRESKELYTLEGVEQYSVVTLTDGADTKASYYPEYVHQAGKDRRSYIIAYGDAVNTTELTTIAGKSLFTVSEESKITETAVAVQAALLKYANSFYQLAYQSELRGGTGHRLKMTISGNTNSGEGSELEAIFNSSPFVDVEKGLYVNWSYSNPEGTELVQVRVGSSRTIKVLSMGGTKLPSFTYTVADNSVVSVTESAPGIAKVAAKGSEGDGTTITIKDAANALEKTINIELVNFQFGAVLYEKWDNMTAGSISAFMSDSRFPDNPSSSSEIDKWEIPTDSGDNYGTRIRGYVHPPASGNYIFWISSDDQSQLFLSTDGSPNNKAKICEVTSWTNAKEWGKESNQKSLAIALEGGKHYYMESLHREGTGGDNLAVAWQMEEGKREVISGDNLSMYLGE